MKKIALLSALLAFSQAASASQILSSYLTKKSDGTYSVSIFSGFSENGFTRADQTCYLGSALGVCSLIAQDQGSADIQYSQGGHGTFSVKSCSIERNTVKLSYDRINDYDGTTEIQIDINHCSE